MFSRLAEFSAIVGVCYVIYHSLLPVAMGGVGLAEHPALSVPHAPTPLAACAIPSHPSSTLFALVPSMFLSMVVFLGTIYGGSTRGLTPFRTLIITTNLLADAASTYALASSPNSPLPQCHDRSATPFLLSVFSLVVVYEVLVNAYHVLMHLPWARRHLHSYHHELDDPIPVLGLYLHPLEHAGVIAVRLAAAAAVGASAEVFFFFVLGEKATVALFHERATALGAWHTRHHLAHDEVTTAAAAVNDFVARGKKRVLA